MRLNLAVEGDKRKTPIGDIDILAIDPVVHKNGSLFIRYLLDDLLDELAEDMRKNLRANYDNFIVVTGGEGSGKSNCTWALLHAFDPDLDIVEAYTYNNEAFGDKVLHGETRGRIFWMDEGSVIANNRDWNTGDNKSFVQTVETCRSLGFTIAADIPQLDRLDKYLREFRMRYLIKVEPMSFEPYGY